MRDDMIALLAYWIKERESIRTKKEAGHPKPWTSDPILLQYRFCNVSREHDKVTRWFAANWRSAPHWTSPNFVPAMMFGRTVNWPDTLDEIGYPEVWDQNRVLEVMQKRKERGEKVWTGAYIVSTNGIKMDKAEYVVNNASIYFANPPKVQPTLEETWHTLTQVNGVGSFMAGQVVTDLKRTHLLFNAPDWKTWAALGPGSIRGLNRIYGNPLEASIPQARGVQMMRLVKEAVKFTYCLQDLQNCLCEFDKYVRVKNGEGKPRSTYPGAR